MELDHHITQHTVIQYDKEGGKSESRVLGKAIVGARGL